MVAWISKLIELLEKLNGYFQKRYPKDTGLYVPEGAKRSQSARFWTDISDHLIPLLVFILILVTGFRVWLIYNYYVFSFKLASHVYVKFANAFGEIKILLALVAVILVGCILFIFFLRNKRTSFRDAIFSFILILISLLSITQNFEIKIEDYIKAKAYYTAYKKFENLEFGSARDVFVALVDGSRGEDVGLDVQRAIAEADFSSGDIKQSIIELTELIAQGSYNEASGEVLLLHTSIYALGKTLPLDEALEFLENLKKNYYIKELSPMWLGIDPQNNLHFLWDYVADFEVDPTDRIVLRVLISKYPDDYYVDLASFAIGDYQYVADNNPNSNFRDWCLYRTAQVAYRKQDFDTVIKYLAAFIKEFPNHRWTDEAVFRLARTYELTGRPDYALDLVWHSDFYQDGDWMGVIRTYRIALIDYYYNSQGLKTLIAGHQHAENPSYLPALEYSLAEQLFKERDLEAAKEQFVKVESSYPQTLFSQYAEHNIEILTRLIDSKNRAGSNWPVEVSKIVMEPYDSDDNYDNYWNTKSLIIYNDLYDGSRQVGIGYVGWSGATWEYFYQTNDYLWAARLLQDQCSKCSNPDEVLYLELLAYYNLTSSSAFIPQYHIRSPAFGEVSEKLDPKNYNSKVVLDQLERISAEMLNNYPNSKYTPEALSINAIGHANMDDYERATQLMTSLINLYPDSRLANNASIFIARSYLALAQHTFDPTLKAAYISKAKVAYEMTLRLYPSGHVGVEASKELNELLSQTK